MGRHRLRTEHILQIAPVLNRAGFRALDFMSSTAMGVAVRTHREDPWQRIRLTRAAVPDAHLQFIGTGLRFISWERAQPDVLRLVYERLVAAGISRFVVLDPTHDMDAVLASARMIRRAGGTEIIMALTYTISAVHDDAFYAGIAGQAAASPYIDRAYIKDPAGLLTPERARTLIPWWASRSTRCSRTGPSRWAGCGLLTESSTRSGPALAARAGAPARAAASAGRDRAA